MDQEEIKTLYTEQVATFLSYRLGGEIAHRVTSHVTSRDISNISDQREAFKSLLNETINYSINDHQVLPLVFEEEELNSFESKFLSIFDDAEKEGGGSSFNDIFDEIVADYLEDILGKELVGNVKKVFMKAVLAMPDLAVDVRFYVGMQAVYHSIPDVWSEIEYAEKVKELSRLLPTDGSEQDEEEAGEVTFEQLVDKILVADLADILGTGHALETVVNTAHEKTQGIFYNDKDRFETFVSHVLEDDFIVRMFDSYWIDERREKWLSEAEDLLK
jgi:hypothetical protein